jgi:photosystem II stability/assembly factor-like uncharacterized protein
MAAVAGLLCIGAGPAVADWTSIGPYGEGVIAFVLALDPTTPTTLYAGTYGGGVFKSTDGGTSWSAVNTGLTSPTVQALALDPTTPTTLYAGTWGGVFKSTDGGGSWSSASTGLTCGGFPCGVSALALDPQTPTTVYAGTSGGVFRRRNRYRTPISG